MKYKINTFLKTIILLVCFFDIQSVYAQVDLPLGKLAQDYITRMNQSDALNTFVSPSKQNAVVVNPQALQQDAVSESIDTISKTIEEVKEIKKEIEKEIKETVKKNIDSSIIEIRKTSAKPAFELQRVIDSERTVLFENISEKIESIKPIKDINENEKFIQLEKEINTSLNTIQKNLESESKLSVTFEKSKKDIEDIVSKFQQVLEEKKEIIESRQGELVFKDSDGDGLSDYDEVYVYKTEPLKMQTFGEGKSDAEKIKDGINPLTQDEQRISYQDPREDTQSFVSEQYKVQKIELIKEEKKLVFEGVALPNTYITLYIYSTPIIVMVRTDQNGQWNYVLEQQIEDGEHQIYVATTDSFGKIITRSNPILFTKSAETAMIGIAGSADNSLSAQNFLKDNFILITLATLIAVVILTMMFVGNHKTIKSAATELKEQVN